MRTNELLAGFAVTDRVVSERDPDPVAAASHLSDQSGKQPLVHFSGKGREIKDFQNFLRRLDENGLNNVLCITGDRLKETPVGGQRPRYLESVPTIQIARHTHPALLIAAAVNPFKYREEDAMAQYLKLGKKVAAGANYGITRRSFSVVKRRENTLTADYARIGAMSILCPRMQLCACAVPFVTRFMSSVSSMLTQLRKVNIFEYKESSDCPAGLGRYPDRNSAP
jgi:5,10-methylenetetrahydrofolate reductase